MKKIWYYFIPILFSLGIFLFWNQIESLLVEYSLQGFCQDCFGGKIQSSKKRSDEKLLVFEKPSVKSLVDLNQGGVNLEADNLKVAYALDLLQKKIDLTVTLINPRFEIGTALEGLSKLDTSPSGFLRVNKKIEIRNGLIVLPHQDVYFDCTAEVGENVSGKVVFRFSDPDLENNKMVLALDPVKGLDLQCSEVDCSHILALAQAIWPSLNHWEIKEGIINGTAKAILPVMDITEIVAKANLSQLSFSSSKLGLEGKIPEISLVFDSNPRIKISEDTALIISKNDHPVLEIKHLLGNITFSGPDIAKVSFDGVCSHHDQAFSLHLEGEGNLEMQDFDLILESPKKGVTNIQLLAKTYENVRSFYRTAFSNLGEEEFEILQKIFSDSLPQLQMAEMRGGTLDAIVVALTNKSIIQEIHLEQLVGRNLHLKFDLWNSSIEIDEVSSHFEIDFTAPDVLDTLNGGLIIKNGRWNIGDSDKSKWLAKNIQTHLNISDGRVRASTIKGILIGMEGQVDIDWLTPHEVISYNFTGKMEELPDYFPDLLKKILLENFQHDSLNLVGKATRHEFGLGIGGEVKVFGNDQKINDTIAFGLDFHRPTDVKKLEIPRYQIENGWFEGHNLPLQKYMSPLIFREDQMHLSGRGDFQGTFDQKEFGVHYDAQDMVLENSDFAMDIKGIKETTGKLAEHYYDFTKGTNHGSMPVRNGSYFDRSSGLLFTDVNTTFKFVGEEIHAEEIETFCNGVYFAGSIDVDYSNPEQGVFSVVVKSHTMNGKFSQIQSLFSHFKKPFFFLKFPLEGNVAFRQGGGYIRMDFVPNDYTLQAHVQGTLTDGTMANQNFDVNLQDLSLDLEYDHAGNQLNFSDIQGTLLVGDPDHVEEYSLAGDHFRFTDYAHNQAEFDLWVGDRQRDIIRVVGKTTPYAVENDDEYISFALNNDLTHFGDVHPKAFQLVLKDWAQIDNFQLQLAIKLDTLLHDLQRFSRTGFFFLSRHLLKEMNDLKTAGGDFSINLNYDNSKSSFVYLLEGNDVSLGNYNFQKFSLKGNKIGHNWSIEQLQLDDVSLAADIFRTENSWKINFLGLHLGDTLLMGLEGEYFDGSPALNATINLLEADLLKMGEWGSFKDFAAKMSPKGQLRATGQLLFELGKGPNGWRAEALLNANLHALELNGLHFQDTESLSMHFVTDKGIVLRKIKTAINIPYLAEQLSVIDLEKADYDFNTEQFSLEGLHFSASVEKIKTFTSVLENAFPHFFSDNIKTLMVDAQNQGDLEGTLNFEMSSPHYALKLALKDGIYNYQGTEHQLHNFVMEFDPCEFKLHTQYQYQQKQFWVTLLSKSCALESGELILSDLHPDEQALKQPLTCHWGRNSETQIPFIHKAEGHFSGLDVNLVRENNELVGLVKINATTAQALFPPEIAKGFTSWEIEDGYVLNGRWTLPHELKNTTFRGTLEGKNFIFKGYQFEQLNALLEYRPKVITLRNLEMDDPCGKIHVDQIDLHQDHNEKWYFSTPMVLVNNLRPSLLRDIKKQQVPASKPLLIRQLDIHELQGELGSANSFVGDGRLYFANPPKRHLANPLFAIPAEILTRIGLDLSVLTPVVGTIYFDIQEGKVLLTKFKDIYSEGHVSKFYMPHNNYQSYIDFSGNLHVQVRMKQYNLLFKLAELFTVTIQGTLRKPTYSLQKQKDEQVKYEPVTEMQMEEAF